MICAAGVHMMRIVRPTAAAHPAPAAATTTAAAAAAAAAAVRAVPLLLLSLPEQPNMKTLVLFHSTFYTRNLS